MTLPSATLASGVSRVMRQRSVTCATGGDSARDGVNRMTESLSPVTHTLPVSSCSTPRSTAALAMYRRVSSLGTAIAISAISFHSPLAFSWSCLAPVHAHAQ